MSEHTLEVSYDDGIDQGPGTGPSPDGPSAAEAEPGQKTYIVLEDFLAPLADTEEIMALRDTMHSAVRTMGLRRGDIALMGGVLELLEELERELVARDVPYRLLMQDPWGMPIDQRAREPAKGERNPAPEANPDTRVAAPIAEDILTSVLENTEGTAIGATCIVCNETKDQIDTVQAPCRHMYCGGCFRRFIEASTRDESLHPPRCCNQELPLSGGLHFLDTELVELFERKKKEFSTSDRTYCVQSACAAFIPPECIQLDVATCSECKSDTCSICKGLAHLDAQCPVEQEDRSIAGLIETENWARCPSCKRVIELGDGCHHITCICHAEFCYVCSAQWKTCRCPLLPANFTGSDDENVAQLLAELDRQMENEMFEWGDVVPMAAGHELRELLADIGDVEEINDDGEGRSDEHEDASTEYADQDDQNSNFEEEYLESVATGSVCRHPLYVWRLIDHGFCQRCFLMSERTYHCSECETEVCERCLLAITDGSER